MRVGVLHDTDLERGPPEWSSVQSAAVFESLEATQELKFLMPRALTEVAIYLRRGSPVPDRRLDAQVIGRS
jgi:hypothetical protein